MSHPPPVTSLWRRRKLRCMLTVGDQVPDATVWFAPRETVSLRDVVEDRPALFLFYLFDWSST
jgi:peroxiredoxin